jgi:transposase-like protein
MSNVESRPKSRHYSLHTKQDAVLRVLKGEKVAAVAEDTGVGVNRLERWHARFMEGGAAALDKKKTRSSPFGSMRTHASGIMQWAVLLFVLTVLVFFLVRMLS